MVQIIQKQGGGIVNQIAGAFQGAGAGVQAGVGTYAAIMQMKQQEDQMQMQKQMMAQRQQMEQAQLGLEKVKALTNIANIRNPAERKVAMQLVMPQIGMDPKSPTGQAILAAYSQEDAATPALFARAASELLPNNPNAVELLAKQFNDNPSSAINAMTELASKTNQQQSMEQQREFSRAMQLMEFQAQERNRAFSQQMQQQQLSLSRQQAAGMEEQRKFSREMKMLELSIPEYGTPVQGAGGETIFPSKRPWQPGGYLTETGNIAAIGQAGAQAPVAAPQGPGTSSPTPVPPGDAGPVSQLPGNVPSAPVGPSPGPAATPGASVAFPGALRSPKAVNLTEQQGVALGRYNAGTFGLNQMIELIGSGFEPGAYSQAAQSIKDAIAGTPLIGGMMAPLAEFIITPTQAEEFRKFQAAQESVLQQIIRQETGAAGGESQSVNQRMRDRYQITANDTPETARQKLEGMYTYLRDTIGPIAGQNAKPYMQELKPLEFFKTEEEKKAATMPQPTAPMAVPPSVTEGVKKRSWWDPRF